MLVQINSSIHSKLDILNEQNLNLISQLENKKKEIENLSSTISSNSYYNYHFHLEKLMKNCYLILVK